MRLFFKLTVIGWLFYNKRLFEYCSYNKGGEDKGWCIGVDGRVFKNALLYYTSIH